MVPKTCITDLPDSTFKDKRVLVREDLNVPFNEDGTIASDFRIQEALPTLKYLCERQAKVIVAAHVGRPNGKIVVEDSLKPVAERLQQLLPGLHVKFCLAWVGPEAQEAVNKLKPGEILVLENMRFDPGEEKNDPEFAKKLAELADIYVNDAFGCAHRAHASTEGVAHDLPIKVAGILMNRELSALGMILENPKKPMTAIVGGSKVSTKITVLQQLLKRVDSLVIGGGMVFTFLKAQGIEVGKSLVEEDQLQTALDLLAQGKKIILPTDIVVADRFDKDASHKIVSVNNIPADWTGLDIGPDSIQAIEAVLKTSKTVFWNGPMGVFEFPAFAQGTRAIAESLAELTRTQGLISVLGGGDTVSAIDQFGIQPTSYTHVSTGGGATLELLEGKTLPGVAILDDQKTAVRI